MKIKGQLSKLFTILSMSGIVYAATVELAPSTLPIGASDSSPYMQALTITFQANGSGSWAANEKVIIYTPTEIGIADPDGDGTYTDGVSVSLSSGAALGVTVSAADSGEITLNFSTGNAIASGDKFTVVFPVTTSGATDGQNENYSITYGSGDEEVGGESATATFESSVLSYVTWNTAYTGDDDSSDDLGQYYPASAADVLSATLTDWVVEESALTNDEVVNGDDTDFESVTLDNTEGGDEMTFSLWFCTSNTLTEVTASTSGCVLVDGDNTDAGTVAPNEGGTFAGVRLDYDDTNGSELIAGTLYFYVTSDWTGDWALGMSGSVVITHKPVFTKAGFDYDVDGDYDNGATDADDADAIYLDSNVKSQGVIDKAGTSPASVAVLDEMDFIVYLEDLDDTTTVSVYLSTTGASCVCPTGETLSDAADNDDEADCETAGACDGGSAGTYTLPDFTGGELLFSNAVNDDGNAATPDTSFTYDIYTDASTFDATGSFYTYVRAIGGTDTTDYQVQNNTTDKDAQKLHRSHFPYFKFTDVYSADDEAFDSAIKQYQYISWAADDVDGDYWVEPANASVKLYASDLGYATAVTDLTSDEDLSNDVANNTVLIATISGEDDDKTDNEYMWDVRNSGLAAGTYDIYAFISDGTNGAVIQYNSGLDDVNNTAADDRSIVLTHGSRFFPVNPPDAVNHALTTASHYEFRWNHSDEDASTQQIQIVLSPTNGLVSDYSDFQGESDYFWVTSSVGEDGTCSDGSYDNEEDCEAATEVWTSYAGTCSGADTDGDGTADATQPDNDQDCEDPAGDDGTGDGDDVAGTWTSGHDVSSSSSYIWDVGSVTTDAGGNAATPSGSYYVYYFFSIDGDWGDGDEYPYQADGTLSMSSATDNDTYFELSPNATTADKDDILTFSVYAQDDAATAEIVSVSISVDTTYFSVQNATSPFTAVTTDFNGTVITDTSDTTGATAELRWVSWADGGDDIGNDPVEVATFQLKINNDGDSSADTLLAKSVSFNTTGEFATGIIGSDNNAVTVTATDATVYLNASGLVSGFIDLQGRSSALADQTVTVDVCPVGSYTASYGGSVTLGDGGTYSVSNVAPGKYTVRVSKDGFLSQVTDNVKVVPFNTTWVHFTGADKLLGGDVTGYTDSSGTSQPNNVIETADATAITDAFNATSADSDWNAYADVDNSGTVYVDDLNYCAENRDGGNETAEGPTYKRSEADNLSALIALNRTDESADRTVFNVTADGIGSLHAYAVEMGIDANEWEVISITDHLKNNGEAIYFNKNNGHQWTAVSALFGHGSYIASELVTLELKPLVDNPSSPVIHEVTLIDDMNRSTKAVISNNGSAMPEEFALHQNFPNPFNPVTNIAFAIPQEGLVELTVFDLLGKQVRQLVSSRLAGGSYTANWNATDTFGNKVSSGLYFYSLTVDNQMIATQKMILMK